LSGLTARRFTAGETLPAPDLILGAGHRTHLSLLLAKTARGGRSIVLMNPSLPTRWFDLCLIPDHDLPANRKNIIVTRGALNTIVPTTNQDVARGLILIGGPSRHYHWDENALLNQLQHILYDSSVQWTVSDSPRTPPQTRTQLMALKHTNLHYYSCTATPPNWLAEQLKLTAKVWVTQDSVSMIYEALTSGAAVGLLNVPAKKTGKLSEAVRHLAEQKLLTTFDAWAAGQKLVVSHNLFNESGRCAKLVMDFFSLPYNRSSTS